MRKKRNRLANVATRVASYPESIVPSWFAFSWMGRAEGRPAWNDHEDDAVVAEDHWVVVVIPVVDYDY